MKANELRIGNWILIPYQNAPIAIPAHETQVQGMTIFGEILTNNTPEHEGLKTNPNHISGIPLTEEWLLKFGFEKKDGAGLCGFYKDILWNKYICWAWSIDVGIEDKNGDELLSFIKIKYVHQLQNLYFALTGNELTINL